MDESGGETPGDHATVGMDLDVAALQISNNRSYDILLTSYEQHTGLHSALTVHVLEHHQAKAPKSSHIPS